ncbi:glycosyltransferase family 4 protein [Desulfovermiculus halophilus]|uniref:glycosyltransferase family 4 protein n=1 Tax=Desulfovermiculus halophilus TaxID=339722 RepID=UPI00068595FF|nr:glycosyltransferase family 1 protein [Desulfovermiculus halophilus]
MDLVTITDHDTIGGNLEIAHLPDTFLSEEVTASFPGDGCKVHVLVYDINEKQHDDISRVRENVFELVQYLQAENIFHALAHPMYSVDGMLEVKHFQQLLLLFTYFELNGARDSLQNTVLRRILNGMSQERISELAERYAIAPSGEDPCQKYLISGSDDHSSLSMGFSYTEVPKANCVQDFLRGISDNMHTVHTYEAGPQGLAHNLYSIIYQYYSHSFHFRELMQDKAPFVFLEQTLLPPDQRQGRESEQLIDWEMPGMAFWGTSFWGQFQQAAHAVLSAQPELLEDMQGTDSGPREQSGTWKRFMQRVFAHLSADTGRDMLSKLSRADLLSLFPSLGSMTSLHLLLAPYLVSYALFARDRKFSLKCLQWSKGDRSVQRSNGQHLALFTDTLDETNGVATVIRLRLEAARLTGKPLTVLNCTSGREQESNVASFEPIGEFDLPEYPELKVPYPPILDILAYCYEQRFTCIHAETPGSMGLAALAVARLLGLPFQGTYHTSLPQTVRSLTGDAQLEGLVWKYVTWFYGQMDVISVPSAATADELACKGLPREKMVVQQPGINTSDFHPAKRNGYFQTHYSLPEPVTKLIYAGRVSKEKNLHVLEVIMRTMSQVRNNVYLVVVGEGPYLAEMQNTCQDLPVLFTGYLRGDDLAQAYASSDIFVFPSTVDTMGSAVIEAQASGLPVIVTDQGGPQENMLDGETGIVVPADDKMADGFAQAILRLCDNPELMAGMGRKARSYAQRYSCRESFLSFWNISCQKDGRRDGQIQPERG